MGTAATSETVVRWQARRSFRYLRGTAYWLAVAVASLALAAVLATIGARLFGYFPYVMYGGSMGSTAPVGSVAFIQEVSVESLQVGDVIVFRPPSTGEDNHPVMHRVVSIEEVDGQRVFRTKGDANASADPWELRLTAEGGRMAFVVPQAGYFFWFFQTRVAWFLVVLPLVAYLGFVALRRIWAPAGRPEIQRTQAP